MFLHRVVFRPADLMRLLRGRYCVWGTAASECFIICLLLIWVCSSPAVTLWSDSGSTLAHDTGSGTDILEGAVKRDDTSNDTLYFKFHFNPLSDISNEEYFAAFEF